MDRGAGNPRILHLKDDRNTPAKPEGRKNDMALTDRMIRASKLDASLYEEVEADRSAFGQAMGIVVLSSVAAGIGGFSTFGSAGLFTATAAALVGWFIWAYLTFIIGTKLFPEPQTEADYGQLLRTIGFSSAPGVIRILGIIPLLFGIVSMIAMVIAVRQALDYTGTLRAVGVCVIGWIVQVALFALIFFALLG